MNAARTTPGANLAGSRRTVLDLIENASHQLLTAGVAFGHGTDNAFDEAAWLVLWRLGLPLDTPLGGPPEASELVANMPVTPVAQAQVATILKARIETRQPAAYLTHEAWLMGVAFYVDERVIVPRSLIAELIVHGSLAPWINEHTRHMLDLCCGSASLAVLAAMAYPDLSLDASDVSADALAVASINLEKHGLQNHIRLLSSDALASVQGPYDLILCNPPYVNAQSMATLPPEFQAEPSLALDGNRHGGSDGMDLIRQLLRDAPSHMNPQAILVLEIGHERAHFEAAFPHLQALWLETSAGSDQVLLLTREALA
jgi:ribosomal protein L3 glutamine methyltransferase